MSLAPSDVKSRSGTAGPKADTILQQSKAHLNFGGKGPALGAATGLMLMFMGATLPGPLYLIYRDELHFSQVTLTLIYAVYFASAVLTAFFLGRLSDQVGRRAAILFAISISLLSPVLFVFADSIPLAAGAGTAWVAELCANRCTGASLTAGFTLAGL